MMDGFAGDGGYGRNAGDGDVGSIIGSDVGSDVDQMLDQMQDQM